MSTANAGEYMGSGYCAFCQVWHSGSCAQGGASQPPPLTGTFSARVENTLKGLLLDVFTKQLEELLTEWDTRYNAENDAVAYRVCATHLREKMLACSLRVAGSGTCPQCGVPTVAKDHPCRECFLKECKDDFVRTHKRASKRKKRQ